MIERLRIRLADERGFTLIEMLIGIATGLIISLAAFGLIDVSLRLSTQVNDRADATDAANAALQTIEQELQSACTGVTVNGGGLNAIQGPTSVTGLSATPGSSSSELTFISAASGSATPTPVLHDVVYSSSAGTLTDTTYPATSTGSGSTLTYTGFTASGSSSDLLASHVTLSGSTPMFAYYAYNSNNVLPTGFDVTGAPAPLTTPLTTATANSAIEVSIDFTVLPHDGRSTNYGTYQANTGSPGSSVEDVVVLRLTPYTSSNAGQCQ